MIDQLQNDYTKMTERLEKHDICEVARVSFEQITCLACHLWETHRSNVNCICFVDNGTHVHFIDIWHFRFCAWKEAWVQNTKWHPKRRWLTHPPPLIGNYLHAYTLICQSYGSIWQLHGTGAWCWARKIQKGNFTETFETVPDYSIQC